MQHNHSPMGIFGAITTVYSALITWVSLIEAQTLMAVVASSVAVIVGFFTIRYYYYATKKVRGK